VKIIGLTGYAQTGKDTVGAMLVERGWHRIGFADNVRALALAADPLVRTLWRRPDGGLNERTERLSVVVARVGWEDAKRNADVRRFLQDLGSGVRDVLGETTWIDAAMQKIDVYSGGHPEPAGVVITDVRHENEAAAVRARGGIIARVTRPGVGPANDHVTEVGVDAIAYDGWITNDGTLVDLEREVEELLEDVAAGWSA
jgi:hypothetical protein